MSIAGTRGGEAGQRGAATPPRAPTEAQLREAALRHLARYAATRAGLIRVLERRIERWRRAAGAEGGDAAESRAAARRVADRLVAERVIDDAAFAQGRARTLLRAGRSARAVAAHLTKRGIGAAMVREVAPEDGEHELAAALLLLRKRRLGPFGAADATSEGRRRVLGILARAGFSHATAIAALREELAAAEQRILRMRTA